MTASVRRYVPHSPGALLEWDPSQDTGLTVVIADDYDKLVARLAASEAERDSMASAKNKWIEQLAAERDSLRAKLAKLEVDAAWGAHNGGAHTLIKMHHADAMELWQALNDLSFACDGVDAPCPPTHKVYNETFAIMNKHRQAYSRAARENNQGSAQSSEKGL